MSREESIHISVLRECNGNSTNSLTNFNKNQSEILVRFILWGPSLMVTFYRALSNRVLFHCRNKMFAKWPTPKKHSQTVKKPERKGCIHEKLLPFPQWLLELFYYLHIRRSQIVFSRRYESKFIKNPCRSNTAEIQFVNSGLITLYQSYVVLNHCYFYH